MSNIQSKETMNKFTGYHTDEVLNIFMGLWPPPDIWEVWNRWNTLGNKDKYIPKKE